MISILPFFNDTEEPVEKHSEPTHSQIDKMSTPFPDIGLSLDDFSFIPFPKEGTGKFESDIECVAQCLKDPVNSPEFNKTCDKSALKILKKYLKKNNLKVDMDRIKALTDQVESIILSLKYKYNRPRPKKYF